MTKLDFEMATARAKELEAKTPGSLAWREMQAPALQEEAKTEEAKAMQSWQAANIASTDYDYVEAHRNGVDLTKKELPNRYFRSGARNVGGFDLSNGRRYTSVVHKDYEGNAVHSMGFLTQSKTRPGKDAPPQDSLGLSGMAAYYQNSNMTYEDYANAFSDFGDTHLRRAWRAGTDANRHQLLSARMADGLLGIYPPKPDSLDFDARMADPEFQKLGRTIYKGFHGSEFHDTDQAAGKWLAGHMRDLDFNTPMQAAIFLKVKNGSGETHQAYAKALEKWDQTNIEWAFLPQLGNAARLVIDPLNLAGAGVGKFTVVTAGRMALKSLVARMGVGVAGGATAGTIQATVKAGVQGQAPTTGEVVEGAVGGAVIGGVISGAADEVIAAAGKGIKAGLKKFERKDYPVVPSGNVLPEGMGARQGEFYAAGEPTPADLRTQRLAQLENKPAQIAPDAGDVLAPGGMAHQVDLEQRPYEVGPEGQDLNLAPAGDFPEGRTADDPQVAGLQHVMGGEAHGAQWGGLEPPEMGIDGQPLEPAKKALGGEPVTRPDPPVDINSQVLIDPATGYYSPAQRAVAEAPQNEMQWGQWQAMMKKTPFQKQDELAWLDMEGFGKKLKPGDMVSRQDLLDHINKNMIKIQRHQLVLQPQNTIPLRDHLTRNDPEYGDLQARYDELDMLMEMEQASRKQADNLRVAAVRSYDPADEAQHMEQYQVHTREIQSLQDRMQAVHSLMDKVAWEHHKAAVESGQRPPGVRGIDELLTDPDGSTEFSETIERMLHWLEEEQKHQGMLAKAKTDADRAHVQSIIDADQRIIRDVWDELDRTAYNMGGIIFPSDIARAESYLRYAGEDVRGFSLMGAEEAGTRIKGGVDPVNYQQALYRHPEGLKLRGTSEWHPGRDATGIVGWAITTARRFDDGETIHFIEEGQNDHVKARRKAARLFDEYKKMSLNQAADFPDVENIRKADSYDEFVWNYYREGKIAGTKNPRVKTGLERRLPEKWADTTAAQRKAVNTDVFWRDDAGYGWAGTDIVAMPKQLFFQSALSNIFKSELYQAAVNGQQWMAWPTAEAIYSRLPHAAPQFLNEGVTQFSAPLGFDHIQYRQGDMPAKELSFAQARELADKMDKAGSDTGPLRKLIGSIEEYDRMRNELFAPNPPHGHMISMRHERIEIREGKLGHYDGQTKKQVEEFVKKYGGKVELKEMPRAPGSANTVKVWAIKMTEDLVKKLLKEGVPIGAAAGAAVTAGQEEETQ